MDNLTLQDEDDGSSLEEEIDSLGLDEDWFLFFFFYFLKSF